MFNHRQILSAIFLLAHCSIYFASNIPLLAEESNKAVTRFKISWPVDTKRTFKISSTFGESRLDHFHNGLDIPGKGIGVYPVSQGRILWKTEAIFKPGEIPFGGGKTVVMDHKGFWSGYMHLLQLNEEIKPNEEVKPETTLGKSGDTGHSGGAHLHFFIFEPAGKKMLNPLPYLDLAWYHNTTPPKTLGYGLVIQNEFINIDPKKSFRLTKDYPLYARILDSGSGNEKWGVYSFESYADPEMKTPIQKFVFNYISLDNFRWKTSNGKVFEDIYYDNLINTGSGFRKTRKLIWKTSGYMGPESVENLDLLIKD